MVCATGENENSNNENPLDNYLIEGFVPSDRLSAVSVLTRAGAETAKNPEECV